MRIKIFRGDNIETVGSAVNEFIQDKRVIDIKYKPEFVSVKFEDGVPIQGVFYEAVLIVYEE